MKTIIDTVTYRVQGLTKKYNTNKVEKQAKKTIPQILWVSYSADPDRPNDILVSSCKNIKSTQLKEMFN